MFVPSDLDLRFVPIVTLVQRYVSTKLEVSAAFLFKKIVGTRQTDGPGATLNACGP